MFVAWTTMANNRTEAEAFAAEVISRQLAVCVQIEGPIISHYRWEGTNARSEELRITFKVLPQQLSALERHVHSVHAYDTPEWVVVRAEHVGEKYLSWAGANSSTPPL